MTSTVSVPLSQTTTGYGLYHHRHHEHHNLEEVRPANLPDAPMCCSSSSTEMLHNDGQEAVGTPSPTSTATLTELPYQPPPPAAEEDGVANHPQGCPQGCPPDDPRRVVPRVSERHPLASRNVRSRMALPALPAVPMPLRPRLPRTPVRSKASPCPSPTSTPGIQTVSLVGCDADSACWWCPANWAHAMQVRAPDGIGPTSRTASTDATANNNCSADPEGRRPSLTKPHPDSFAGSIRHALVIGHLFSMLYPEGGSSLLQQRTHRWTLLKLARALYAAVVVIGLSVQAALSLYREMWAESLWDSSVDMMFFGSATAASLLFLELGPRWRRLTQAFEGVEDRMSDFGYPRHLRRSMRRLTAVVLLGAAVEHILSVWSAVDFTWPCYTEAGAGGLLKGYARLKFPMTFDTTYNPWAAVVVLLFNFVGTFFWNFNHLFVMLISMPLSRRFQQVNDRLEAVTGRVMTDDFWRKARETYNELSILCRQVDDAIGKLVLLSFASNMYFICRQLLHSFRTLRTGFWYNLYFSYSFGYMLLRTVLVSLFAASVHDQSRRPLPVLFGVPAEGFTHEVERFMSQVTRDHVALTGCRFFSVTRGLILTVAGTIISYEIVLMQLHPPTASGTVQNRTDHMTHCRQ